LLSRDDISEWRYFLRLQYYESEEGSEADAKRCDDDGVLNRDEAVEIAEKVLRKNAVRLYGL
jgi:hypothetical protein